MTEHDDTTPALAADDRATAPGGLADGLPEDWDARVGQLETVLRFFGHRCSLWTRGTDRVQVSAERVEGGTSITLTGPLATPLTEPRIALLGDLGWTVSDDFHPVVTRLVAGNADLHVVALDVAHALHQVYDVRPDVTWTVSPPEFGDPAADLLPATLDPAADLVAERRRVLRDGAGAELLAAVASTDVTWADLVEAGLPRGDKRAELAMLYRADCPLVFLRASGFHLEVLADPALPTTTASAVLATAPTAVEVDRLSRRTDLDRGDLTRAAERGARLAAWRGRSGAAYLRSGLVSVRELEGLSARHDDDTAGMLRHPRCPESVVLKHVLSRSAQVRFLALRAVQTRGLTVDAALLRLAGQAPMVERPHTHVPYAERARALVRDLLEDR